MNINSNKEFNRLQEIGNKFGYGKGINSIMVKYTANIFKQYMGKNKSLKILELGPAEGIMTDILANEYKDYTVVDAVTSFCDDIKRRHNNIKVYNSLFEEFIPKEKYDVIILGHVLEHVKNPVEILKLAKEWITIDGIILTAVPNANSIHRKAAVFMNILKSEDELGETDYLMGHRRVYNSKTLEADFMKAELKIKKIGGYWLKPLTNKQIEDTWNEEMVNAFMKLGEELPDIAAELYVVATK